MRIMTFVAAALISSALTAGVASAMSLSSPDIKSGGTIALDQVLSKPYGFGCEGNSVSPALMWRGAPKKTQSFAVSVYDPDAPTGSGFWHWVVIDIPANVTSLPKGAGDPKAGTMPAGAIQTRTDFGAPGYGGPCPPKGDKPHHYHFTVFAVDVPKLGVDANTSAAIVGFMLHFHTLAKASFVGTYGH